MKNSSEIRPQPAMEDFGVKCLDPLIDSHHHRMADHHPRVYECVYIGQSDALFVQTHCRRRAMVFIIQDKDPACDHNLFNNLHVTSIIVELACILVLL